VELPFDRPESPQTHGARPPASLPGRSLVCCHPPASARAWRGRPSALFLSHLIAVSQSAPQIRARRRAGAIDAAACYAIAARRPPPVGIIVRRSM
jgi:hypothetical protein